MGSQRGLAIRPIVERGAADGDAGSLPRENYRHTPFEHDHLVTGRDNTRSLLRRDSDLGWLSADAEELPARV